jgi:hypothetical protein
MKKPPPELDKIVDLVLSYHPVKTPKKKPKKRIKKLLKGTQVYNSLFNGTDRPPSQMFSTY